MMTCLLVTLVLLVHCLAASTCLVPVDVVCALHLFSRLSGCHHVDDCLQPQKFTFNSSLTNAGSG